MTTAPLEPHAPPQRETTLHLLFLRGEQVALHPLSTGRTTYFGANVLDEARAAGLNTTALLRRLHFQALGEDRGVRRAECVWHVQGADNAGLRWQAVPGLQERERGWVDAARTPPSNVPWMHPGWHAHALDWLDEELAAQGRARTGEPEVLKHWQISVLWRVPTRAGPVYFKAVPDFFGREVQVTPVLARELTGAAPPVLAADTARGFLLLDDAGTEPGDVPELATLLRHVAQVQRQARPLLPGLGLRDRGPAYVLRWLDHLLTDETLRTGQADGFTGEESARLRAHRPALVGALERLASSPLPATLGHGDLHGGNVVTRDGRYTLLDWSDACVTHPFLDADPDYFLGYQAMDGPTDTQRHTLTAARDAYLHAWADVAAPETLRALHGDAMLASELYRALGYVDGIQAAVEDKTEWRDAHLDHLRRLLRRLNPVTP